MQKIITNFIIVFLFCLWSTAVSLPFISQYYLQKGSHCTEEKNILAAYETAHILNPFDTLPLTEKAEFFLTQSPIAEKRNDVLIKAENLYEQAIKLNPRCCEHYSALGLIQITQFQEDPKTYKNSLTKGLDNLKLALSNDPFGVNASYTLGYSFLTLWNYLSDADHKLALEKLKYALTYRQVYTQHIYRILWEKFKDFRMLQQVTPQTLEHELRLYDYIRDNNLWQFRKAQERKMKICQAREDPIRYRQEILKKRLQINELKNNILPPRIDQKEALSRKTWWGRSENGNTELLDGNMYSSGTLHTLLDLSPGTCSIGLLAKGESADQIWPYIIVELDGEEIGETFVNTSDWTRYSFQINTLGGRKVLSVHYVNDIYNPKSGLDGNLYISEVRITHNE